MRSLVFFLIFFLIVSTSFVKNSTKNIEDEIYSLKENLFLLENRLKDSKLEFDYLSSSERLLEFQNLYFENSLQKKTLNDIDLIDVDKNELIISELTIIEKNEN